jgi:hypothetical protein
MAQSHLPLTPEQEPHLTELPTRGPVAVKTYRRASALLARHAG